MPVAITGTGVSRGIAIGGAHLLAGPASQVPQWSLAAGAVDDEIVRFRAALAAARAQLRQTRERIPHAVRAEVASFIDAHLLMLDDAMLTAVPEGLIRERGINAEWALQIQRDAIVSVFDEMDDPYLRTRRDDVDHVIRKIQGILGRGSGSSQEPRPGGSDLIWIAEDLSPADAVLMHHHGVQALVTEYGSPISHTAILARSLGIPAVMGARNLREYLVEGEVVVVDGEHGVVLAGLDAAACHQWAGRRRSEQRRRSLLQGVRDLPSLTQDGIRVSLQANIELAEDVLETRFVGADGVGLFRTEFLYMNRERLPDEEEQLVRYGAVISELKGLPLTIRTLDLGADKQLGGERDGRPSNPALGLRALRLCLQEPDLFRTQLRAILRASALGPVRLLVPMLSTCQELEQLLELLQALREELDAEGLAYDPRLPIGGMIEVPAAALMVRWFARRLDFLSIGTNDLIQYTLAIDRVDDSVAHLYDPLHPGVLRLIDRVIRAGRECGIPVAMCGEMAADPLYTRLLLGLGLRDFSMHPARIAEVKQRLLGSSAAACRAAAGAILEVDHPEEIRLLLEELNLDA